MNSHPPITNYKLPITALFLLAAVFLLLLAAPAPSADLIYTDASQPAPAGAPRFRVFVSTSMAKDHQKMIAAAMPLLHRMAKENNFDIDITPDPEAITDEKLSHYDEFIMLQQAPFDIPEEGQKALEKFVESGHGWVGIHAAGLPGRLYEAPDHHWQWFQDLLGGVSYTPHPAYQKATLVIETHDSPITKGLPDKMEISDEWYEFDKSPRLNKDITVLAHVDESTYHQNKPMGDHPMIWINTKYHRAIYISPGHDPTLVADPNYQLLLKNAILWAAEK